MPLIFKKAAREDLSKFSVYVDDTSTTSPKYFRVSDVPQVLTKGKNLIRISAHPTNLVPGSQILVDVRDSNGNPIYFEIPKYLEQDKSRVISIWVYHDKGDDNTANGDATITLIGVSRSGENGEPIPSKFRGKPNVRWQTVVNVDRDRDNISPIIFEESNLPFIEVSESIEVYKNQPQSGNSLDFTTSQGSDITYIYKGKTPIVKLNDDKSFNSEMLGYNIVLSNFVSPAQPESKIKNPISSNEYTTSIVKIIDDKTAVLKEPFITLFEGRDDLVHTYNLIKSADYKITYFQSGSNVTTENQRSFANISLNGTDPIIGIVDKIKVLIKSDGLPGEYELLNEVSVPFSSSFSVKVPVPSENLQDPKLLKIQYLNSIGEISRTETITSPFVFQGGNTYIGGGKNLISGSMFISDTIGSGIEMGGVSSGFIRSVGYDGITSASLGKGPGGFVIYSGSGNLQLGDDVLSGVGMEMVGDNDDRHLIFTTANGGLLDVKTDKFFIGTNDTQFISGSDSNIEISSSLFHLDPQNNLLVIGADAVINADLTVNNLRTPAIIDGEPSTRANSSSSIDADGFARFVSASIGGFEVSETQINSANDNLILKDSGQITGSNVKFSGGEIAGFEITNSQINSTNNNIILKASGQITASDGFLFGDKNASQYVQYDDGNLVVRGDLSVDQIFTPATIGGSPSNETNASSSIKSDGYARFVSASIGGWDITTGSIQGGNLLMRPEGILQTRDFASGLKGWKISSEGNGTAEFENVRIRGTMRTTTFEKESVNAVGGQLWVTNSTTITGSVAVGDTTMSIKNVKGFVEGEILLVKKVDSTGFQTEYILLNSSSIDGDQSNEDENYGRIYVERAYGSGTQGDFVGDLASTAQTYEDGQVVVSTGKVGTGYIKLNANPSDQATPYIDIVERTGSDLYDVKLAARLGDLSGLAGSQYVFGNPNPGFGLATDNVYLQGGIIANTGSIGGIQMESGKLYNGGGNWANSNTGFYIDSDSNFSLGDRLTWDGSSLVVRGQIQLADGTGVEEAINAVTESSTARALSIGVDSQVYAFDTPTDTTATPDTIVFTISQQNLSGTITTSDVTITKNGGGTITTPTLDGVVTDGSGQLSGSLSFAGSSLLKSELPLTIEVSKDSLLDTTTILKVEGGFDGTDGDDAVTTFLTNESHTFPAATDGTISSFVGGETDMIVFQGVTDVTNDYTFSRVSNTGVTSTISGNTVTITGMAHDSGSVIITAISESVSLPKTMSLAKSKQGDKGDTGDDNQDFTWANENLTGIGPIVSPGLLMTSNVFGFHDGIAGSNGSLDDFTSYLDSDGNFYLGSGSSDAQFVWDNTSKELLVSGSNAKIEVDKFFVGTSTSQFISGSNGIIEISSSNFHLDPNGNAIFDGKITAREGRIADYTISGSNLDALRLAEEFTPINTVNGSIIYGNNLPTDEIDSRAEILIGNTLYGISTIGTAAKTTSITLDSATYENNKDFTIFYSGSEEFNAGTSKFETLTYDSRYLSESIYALTTGVVSNEFSDSQPYFPTDENSKNILSSVFGVDSLVFELQFETIEALKSADFVGYYFLTQEEERFRFFTNNANLELLLDTEADWFVALRNAGDITSAELSTIQNSLFLYSEEIAENGGIRADAWYGKFFSNIYNNGLVGSGLSYLFQPAGIGKKIPVLGTSNHNIEKFNPQTFNQPPTSQLNYESNFWHSVYLAPGYFINPEVIAILDRIDSDESKQNATPSDTWWEIESDAVDGVGAPFKLVHNFVEEVRTPSTDLRLQNAVWPSDIVESGEIPLSGGTLNQSIANTGRTTPVNITSRINDTTVSTDLTTAELQSLYGGSTYPNHNSTPYTDYITEYEAIKSFVNTENVIGSGVNTFIPKVSVGELSSSFREKVTFQISGSGTISSSKFFVDELGNISGSNVNFIGGTISGSDLTLVADTFQFGNPASGATIQGGGGTLQVSSSLFSLTEEALSMKGELRASSGYIQDTYMGGKVISTGVLNPSTQGVRYQIPFIEVYSTSSNDVRFTSTSHTSSVFQGSHGSWVLSSVLSKTPQMLTKTPTDGVPYPDEFKAWFDISGVNNDYKYISDFTILDINEATDTLTKANINNQFILNKPDTPNTASTAFATMTSEFINIAESLPEHGTNAHLQFAIRGTTHPYSGSFVGFYPEYLVEIVSGSETFYSRQYKDENACNHDWTVFDVPISDVLRVDADNLTETTIRDEFKVKVGMRYSGSAASGTITGTSKGLGWAMTEMRLVEPVRAASLDTQTLHFKDTYFTSDGKLSTAHKGNLIPLIQSQSNSVSSSFSLGSPKNRWKDAYFGLSENNIVSASNVENKLVRIDVNSGKLSYTSASIGDGGGGGSYTHPTHPGDDINIDTGALTGATVISDLDFNVTTDTLGHVTDANGSVSTRTLTLANLGYTGATDATNNTGTVTSVATGTGLTGGTITSTGTISLSHLGFQDLTDPNDDRIAFWDDSDGAMKWLDIGTNLSISGTTLSATAGSSYYFNVTKQGGAVDKIISGETLTFRDGSNIFIEYDTTGNTITINSTDTNTTYSAGSGLDLSGTTFSIESDLRDGITHIGLDTTDYISFTNNTRIDFFVNGGNEMRLESDGDLHVDGDVIAYSTTISDRRLKDNIFTIESALDKVTKLRGVEYIWKGGARKGQSDIGFIAQEVEEVIPQIVREKEMPLLDGGTYKTVDYEKVTALLIEAVKEQKTIISKLEQRIVTLESGSKN